MPCCAFALFVIGQIAAGCVALAHALGIGGERGASSPINPATAWQLHAGPPIAAVPRPRVRPLRPALLLIALLEIGAFAAGIGWLRHAEHTPAAATDARLCGSPGPLVEVASLGDR